MSDLSAAINSLHGKTVTVKVEGTGDAKLTPVEIQSLTMEVQRKLMEQGSRSKARRVAGWAREVIDRERVAEAPALERTVVAVAPGMPGHMMGVVAAGRSAGGDFYVLGDYSMAGGPDTCIAQAVRAYRDHGADCVVGEVNLAGDYLRDLLYSVDPNIPLRTVHGMRGLAARVEPLAALYEQGRVHHAGTLASLEGRMSAWTTQTTGTESQVSALVWAIIELKSRLLPDSSRRASGRMRLRTPTSTDRAASGKRWIRAGSGLLLSGSPSARR